MDIKSNLKYLESHEWVDLNGNVAKIGITDFAQNELGDLVFVELPSVGTRITAGNEFANVESVKAVSPVNSPVTGKVIAVNDELENSPELINEKPYDAWFVTVEIESVSENLLDATAYAEIAK